MARYLVIVLAAWVALSFPLGVIIGWLLAHGRADDLAEQADEDWAEILIRTIP